MRQVTLIGLVVAAIVAGEPLLTITTGAWAQGDKTHDAVLFAKDVMVPTRDGIHLATDVYRPALEDVPVEDKFPVLLQRTPYNKDGRGFVERAKYFAEHGYVVVLQDIRGRYKSEGVFSKYYDFDAPDGFDTIEWIAALPYSSERFPDTFEVQDVPGRSLILFCHVGNFAKNVQGCFALGLRPMGDRVAVAWSDLRAPAEIAGAPHPDLYYRASEDGGFLWSESEQRVDDDPMSTAISAEHQVALEGPYIYFLWVDYRLGNADLWYRAMDSSGLAGL